MTLQQVTFTLPAYPRGFHLITEAVLRHIPHMPHTGMLFLFLQHTSAGIVVNENCDPDVLHDFESVFNVLVPENMPFLKHVLEGPDDMPAHIKSVLTGHSVSIPITNHRPALGRWQGIYLCEFRNNAHGRTVVASVLGHTVNNH